MNYWLRHYYAKYREQGYSAAESLRAARIREEWDDWENEGLVKLELVPDDSPDLSHAAKKERELAEREGVWGQVGYWRLDADDAWRAGDSIWGLVGCDWASDNPYSADIMENTLEELLEAMTPNAQI